jgi:hypothetical protein
MDLKRTGWIIGLDTTDGQKAIRKGRREMTHEGLSREEEEVTQHMSKDVDGTEVDQKPKRLNRGLLIGAAAVALLLMGACQSREEAPVTDQAPGASEAQENPVDAKALEVATGFLEAYGAFDVAQARTYLADGATIASMGADDDLRLLISYLEATGYQHILDPCEAVDASALGTSVHCPFEFHALRSGELGLGPYAGGAFDLVVRDGEIVQASQDWEIEEFSPQVWEPFAEWVSRAYPEDAAVMYTDESYSNVRLTEESVRLWERRTRGYVREVGRA